VIRQGVESAQFPSEFAPRPTVAENGSVFSLCERALTVKALVGCASGQFADLFFAYYGACLIEFSILFEGLKIFVHNGFRALLKVRIAQPDKVQSTVIVSVGINSVLHFVTHTHGIKSGP
tara:strand:+ start:46 stop:405 length:360 start_codon:yes stop_codon:yes gene_type:complete